MEALVIYVDARVHNTRIMLPDEEIGGSMEKAADNVAVLAAGYKEFASLMKSLAQGTLRRYDGWKAIALVTQPAVPDYIELEDGKLPEGAKTLMVIDAPDPDAEDEEANDDGPQNGSQTDQVTPNAPTREEVEAMSKDQLVELLMLHGVEEKDIDKKEKREDMLKKTLAVVFIDA